MKDSKEVKKRKRSAHGTRASAACSRCRKVKSKCERGPSSISCARCESLGHECSFLQDVQARANDNAQLAMTSIPASVNDQFASIETDLIGVLQKVREAAVTNSMLPHAFIEASSRKSESVPPQEEAMIQKMDPIFFNYTPIIDILDISKSSKEHFSREIGYQLSNSRSDVSKYDLIELKILKAEFALELFSLCYHSQKKWVSFPDNVDMIQLFSSIRKSSPLLMATCCLVGLKYCRRKGLNEFSSLRQRITKIVGELLRICSFDIPQSTDYFQSIILISSHASTLSYKETYFDGWSLSGNSLIHFITREMNSNSFQNDRNNPESFLNFKIWNMMCLINLSHCILSGRPSLIDELRFDQCRDILDSSLANTFDGEIVAYISIMLTLYNSLILKENVNISTRELEKVYDDWAYLCEQSSSSQYVELFYVYSLVMVYRRNYLALFMPNRLHVSLEEYNRDHIVRDDQNLKQIIKKLDASCMKLLKIATTKLDYRELFTSIDLIKFIISFTTLLLTSIIQAGLVEENHERKELLKATEILFSNISQDYNTSNHFDKGISTLISKNLNSIFK